MSERKRRKGRVHSTIDDLPEPIKTQFEVKLANPANTYNDLSQWLKDEGYVISKSAIGRYAVRTREAAQRVAETLQRTQAIAQVMPGTPGCIPDNKGTHILHVGGQYPSYIQLPVLPE